MLCELIQESYIRLNSEIYRVQPISGIQRIGDKPRQMQEYTKQMSEKNKEKFREQLKKAFEKYQNQ